MKSSEEIILCVGSSLSRLELSDNPMTSKISSELAETIRSQPNLKALVLNDTLLCEDGETEGLSEICEALKDSASGLEELEFALNEITPEGGEVCQIYTLNLNFPRLKR